MGLVAGAFQALDSAIVNRWFMAVGDPDSIGSGA